uniref:CSON011361 protein n=1 Tax=Culicoides sonorensis TaxID=179676 RepID=A0A336KM62_CULSO
MKLTRTFLVCLCLGIVLGAQYDPESESSESVSVSEEDSVAESSIESTFMEPEDILFKNLKELLRAGDSDFGIPVWAPYVDDSVVVEGLNIPFKFILDGFDNFEKIQTTIHLNNTVEFQIFFPQISFFLEWNDDEGFIAVRGSQMNTSLFGAIQFEPQRKCIRLTEIDVALDYDTIEYDIVKRGEVHPIAEEFVFEYAEFFRSANKLEILDAYEEMIEDEVKEVFERLECWTYNEEKLLSSIKNSIE